MTEQVITRIQNMLNEKKFNKIFSAVIMAGMLISIAIATAFKLQDPGVNRVMLLVAGFGSLMGVLSTVLSANALIWTFLFGILDVVLDSVVALDAGAPGNFALHAFYFLPMQFVGIWQWRKRGATSNEEVKARKLRPGQWGWVALAVVGGTALSYVVLLLVERYRLSSGAVDAIDHAKVFFDAAVLDLNIVGQVMLSMAFCEQWYIWNLVNVFSILLWGNRMLSSVESSYTVVMFIKYIFYLLNSINGLRIWYALAHNASPGRGKV